MWLSRFNKTVGPNGTALLCNVTDGGKTNVAGHLVYSGVMSHKNPILCTIFCKAAMLLWRLLFMGETFPDMLKPESYYTKYVLRTASTAAEGSSYRYPHCNCNSLLVSTSIHLSSRNQSCDGSIVCAASRPFTICDAKVF